MSGDPDDVELLVRMRFGNQIFSQSYRFSHGHLDLIRRPPNPLEQPGSDPRDLWDFSRRLNMRQKVIDMISTEIALSMATAFDKEFDR